MARRRNGFHPKHTEFLVGERHAWRWPRPVVVSMVAFVVDMAKKRFVSYQDLLLDAGV